MLIDIEDYKKTQTTLDLLTKLAQGKKNGNDVGLKSIQEIEQNACILLLSKKG